MNTRKLSEIIIREFLENNIIEKDAYLSWREERIEVVKEVIDNFIKEEKEKRCQTQE